jgi:hypothetical protein
MDARNPFLAPDSPDNVAIGETRDATKALLASSLKIEKHSRVLVFLTAVLIILTAVLAILTFKLAG